VHTNLGGGWVTVDLEAVRPISTIKIFNRADGWLDDGLPLRLELSQDDQRWTEVERRTTSFSATAPWVATLQAARARYVRVASDKYVALTEIEIFGP
jgi:F5/8 type C domain